MKTVPLADGSGTIPLRASKNPVLAVFRHHCGEVSTVHQPRGKKAHLRYILCDKCGCDQASGASYQEKIRDNSFNSIEELEDFERLGVVPSEYEYHRENNLTDTLTDKVTVNEQPAIELETKPDAVVTVNNALVELPGELPAEKVAIVTEPVTVTKPTSNQQTVTTPKPVNVGRVGLAALFGGLFGIALALAR
jgi:hypothetical protein